MADKIKQYYDYLQSKGEDLPDEEKFRSVLSDQDKADQYYDYLKGKGLEVPASKESFFNTFNVKKKEVPEKEEMVGEDFGKDSDSKEKVSKSTLMSILEEEPKAGPQLFEVSDEDLRKPVRKEVEGEMLTAEKIDPVLAAEAEEKLPGFLETSQKAREERLTKTLANIDTALLQVDDSMKSLAERKKAIAKEKAEWSAQTEGFFNVMPQEMVNRHYEELNNIYKQEAYLRDSKNILKKSKRFAETADAGVLESALKGTLGKDFFSLGVTEIMRDVDVLKAAKKYEKGEELTDAENMALYAYGLNQRMQNDVDQGFASMIGSGLRETIPFMAQMAISSPAGAAAKTAAQKGLTRTIRGMAEKKLGQLASEAVGSIVGAAVRVPVMSDFYITGLERQIGEVTPYEIEGKPLPYIDPTTQKSAAAAFSGSFVKSFGEVLIEDLGRYASPIFNKASKKMIANPMTAKIGNNTIDRIRDATSFNTYWGELGEELVQQYYGSAIEGELDPRNIYTPKEFLATALTVGMISGTMSGANVALNAKHKERAITVETFQQSIKSLKPQTVADVDRIFEGDNVQKNIDQLDIYLRRKQAEGATSQELAKVINYAVQKSRIDALSESQTTIQSERQKPLVSEEQIAQLKKEKAVTPEKKPETLGELRQDLMRRTSDEMKKDYPDVQKLAQMEEEIDAVDARIAEAGGERIQQLDTEIADLRKQRDELYTGEETGLELQQKAQQEEVLNKQLTERLKERQDIRTKAFEKPIQPVLEEKKEAVEPTPQKEVKAPETAPKQVEEEKPPVEKEMPPVKEEPEGVAKVYERPEMEYPVSRVVIGGKERFIQRMEGVGDTGWYEVKKDETGTWQSVQSGKEMDFPIGYTKKETIDNLKKETDAEKIREKVEVPSPQERVEGQEGERLRVRDTEEAGMEAQAGEEAEQVAALEKANSIESLDKAVKSGEIDPASKEYAQKHKIAEEKGWQTEKQVDKTEVDRQQKMDSVKEKLEKDRAKPKQAGFTFLGVERLFKPKGKQKEIPPLKRIIKKYFQREKGMPESAFKEVIEADSRVRGRQYDIKKSVRRVANDIQAAYGDKLSDENLDDIQTAIENVGTTTESIENFFSTVGKNIPKQAIPSILEMRDMLDNYSNELAKLGMIGLELSEKIDKNKGYYITRTYKKHTDKNWVWDNIDDKIKEDAVNKILELNPEMTPDEALGFARSLLEDADIVSSVIRQGNTLDSIEQSNLKKRSQWLTDNPEIRALLGENREPFYNYAVSLVKMAEMIERGKMVENIIASGKKEGWLSEKASDENNLIQKPLSSKSYRGRPGVEKLSDFYATPEVAEALNSFLNTDTGKSIPYKVWLRGVTAAKIAKTALSFKGIVRNILSNPTNLLANGNWNVDQIVNELLRLKKDPEGLKNFHRELVYRGIIGDTYTVGELMTNINELNDKISFISKSDEFLPAKVRRKVRNAMLEAYGFGDDIYKTYRYISEYTRYNKSFSKYMSADVALEASKVAATDILHRTSAYYSQAPLFVQNMRKLPFGNTFISFPYLTISNYLGTWDIGLKELKDPKLRHIGIQRLSGSLMAVSALAGKAFLKNLNKGQDEKDMEAWRRFLPDFWQNDIIEIQEVKNGKALYKNVSFQDYYGALTKPMLMLHRKMIANGKITSDDLTNAALEFGGNFISYDILFDKVTNLKANQDSHTGFKIYNKSDTWKKQFADMVIYLADVWEPGTMTDARRIYKAAMEGEDWQKYLLGMVKGTQVRTIDPLKAMDKYKLYDYREGVQNSFDIYKNELRSYNRKKNPGKIDKEILMDAKKRSENALNGIVREIRLDVKALQRLGISEAKDKVNEMMSQKGFNAIVRDYVYEGGKIKLDEEGYIE